MHREKIHFNVQDIREKAMQSIPTHYQPAGTLRSTWIIAARQTKETLFARRSLYTLGLSLFFVVMEVRTGLNSVLSGSAPQSTKGLYIAIWLSWAVVFNVATAVLSSVNAFAGDKERGSLLPLLAMPASNLAIFAGKVLGSILPACLYALIGVIFYFGFLSVLYGANILHSVPWGIVPLVLILALGMMILGSVVASIISSRTRKLQTAQAISSMISSGILVGVLFGSLQLNSLSTWVYPATDAALILLDIVLVVLAATTWKREEVMARI
jgi:ABC-type Na+ efflux pump permease subunit